MEKKCGTCQRSKPDARLGKLKCEHYGIKVNDTDGKGCDHWVPMTDGPKMAIEPDANGKPKIVLLRTETQESRSQCIAKLAALLEDAKSGKLRDVLIVGFRDEHEVTFHWTPQTDANGFKFVGALYTMAQHLVGRMKLTMKE